MIVNMYCVKIEPHIPVSESMSKPLILIRMQLDEREVTRARRHGTHRLDERLPSGYIVETFDVPS